MKQHMKKHMTGHAAGLGFAEQEEWLLWPLSEILEAEA